MAEKLDPRDVSFEEPGVSNVIGQEALINLPEKKGIITKAELLTEIKRIRNKQNKIGAK